MAYSAIVCGVSTFELMEEIVKAELAGKSILIELDANSKLGNDIIPGDPHSQSENGKLLAGIIRRHNQW